MVNRRAAKEYSTLYQGSGVHSTSGMRAFIYNPSAPPSLLGALIPFMPKRPYALIFALLFSTVAVAQTATPPAKPSQKTVEGTVGDCPGYPENCAPQRKKSKDVTTRAAAPQGGRAIHNSALIIDTHADTPGRFVDENF